MTYNGRVEAQVSVPSGTIVTSTNGAGSAKSIPIPANTYFLSALLSTLQSQLNTYSDSTNWTVSLSTGANGTGQVTINCSAGTFGIAFTSAPVGLLLGFAASFSGVSAPLTGTTQARGLWIPDCPLALDGDPRVAPTPSDRRVTQSPTGAVYGLVGNRRYVHRNVRWTHVPANRTWINRETLANQSWERFVSDTQDGFGADALAAWFRPQTLCQIYDLNGQLVGGDSFTAGWALIGAMADTPVERIPGYTGLWSITLPSIVGQLAA